MPFFKPDAAVYMHTAEHMFEVADGSATLLMGGGLSWHGNTPWGEYAKLYRECYCREGDRILKPGGLLITFQTDAYAGGYIPRNLYLQRLMHDEGWRVVDTRVWSRAKSGLRQPAITYITIWRRHGEKQLAPTYHRLNLQGPPGWRDSVWRATPLRHALLHGGSNPWPHDMCLNIVLACTAPGDLVVDCFAGSCGIVNAAGNNNRAGVGYEIDEGLIPYLKTTGIVVVGPKNPE